MHLMHAFTMEGTPLGCVWHKLLVRASRSVDDTVGRPTRSQRQNTVIEDKESIRWIEGLAVAQSIAIAQSSLGEYSGLSSEDGISRKGMVPNSLPPVNGSQPGPSSNEVNPCRPTHQL